MDNENLITLTDAIPIAKITRQALYMAIYKGKLKIVKRGKKIFTCEKWIREYQASKYDHSDRKINGELMFDPEKGLYSITQALVKFNDEYKKHHSRQRIYYALRVGELKGYRRGGAYIIREEDAKAFWQGKDARQMEMSI